MTRSRTALACSSALVFGLISAALLAGPLDPPAGPVASTHKTLSEVEPRIAINAANTPGDADSLYKITQPGSYYLTGNITGVTGKHGIEIAASGVTLDLNGFDLVGVPFSLDGVSSLGISFTNITVMNGSIRNWGGDGIDITTVGRQLCRIREVLTTANGGRGLFVTCGVLDHCAAAFNTGKGIEVGAASSVSNCSTRENVDGGFESAEATSFSDCTAYRNTGDGFLSTDTCTFTRCIARDQLGRGFALGRSCALSECSSSGNGGDGFSLIECGALSQCTAVDNAGSGMNLGAGSTIAGCAARNNQLDGILAATECAATNCSVSSNHRNGINVGFGSMVSGCAVTVNAQDGILGSAYCHIRDNEVQFNTGSGIHVSGNGNRIEGNNIVAANRVIDIGSSGNIIIRNSGQGILTPTWFIVAGNAFGPIVFTPSGPSVNGSSAAAALGTTDPNANFSY